jgi:NAD-dependent deacetylase
MRCEACGYEFSVGYEAWDCTKETCHNQARGCICRKGIKPNVVFFNESAPKYADLYRTLKDLTDEDVVLVIGTSGEVLPIDQYLSGTKGYKILVNPKPMTWDCWDLRLHRPATETIEEIDAVLGLRLGQTG